MAQGSAGIPPGTALPDYPGGPLVNKPFLCTEPNIPEDLTHSWVAAILDYDYGAMDGFMWGEWPTGKAYYGRGIPVPLPSPGLVHIGHKHKNRCCCSRGVSGARSAFTARFCR
jgi:hypothetical protein